MGRQGEGRSRGTRTYCNNNSGKREGELGPVVQASKVRFLDALSILAQYMEFAKGLNVPVSKNQE